MKSITEPAGTGQSGVRSISWRYFFLAAILFLFPLRPSLKAAETSNAAPEPRNWSNAPAIVEINLPVPAKGEDNLIYAVGDAHADYGRLVSLLSGAGLIESPSDSPKDLEKVEWKAGKAVLVCTGDMIDRYDNSIEVLRLFMRLQAIAPASGGRVIVTMGNHEAEFLAKPDNFRVDGFAGELRMRGLVPTVVAAGQDSLGLGRFLRSLPLAARVDDWFFAHAGNMNSLNASVTNRPRTMIDLKNFLQSNIDQGGFGSNAVLADDSLLEARLQAPAPWWEKPGDTPPSSGDRLRSWIAALGTPAAPVHHLVIGHQPGKVVFNDGAIRSSGEMYERFNGSIFLIDCGMSRGVGESKGFLLRIRSGKHHDAARISHDDHKTTLWPEAKE